MSFIKLDGLPGFDIESEIPKEKKSDKVSRLLQLMESSRNTYRLGLNGVSGCVEQRVSELRRKYKDELQRLLLHVHRPGITRVYIPEMKREFLLGPDKTPLASIWVEWPNPGDYIVVIRSEIYVGTAFGLGGHGCEGEA